MIIFRVMSRNKKKDKGVIFANHSRLLFLYGSCQESHQYTYNTYLDI